MYSNIEILNVEKRSILSEKRKNLKNKKSKGQEERRDTD
jgi:hypothetical protein